MSDYWEELERMEEERDTHEYAEAQAYQQGRADAIQECIEIVKFYESQYDGICWAIRDLEQLKEKKE